MKFRTQAPETQEINITPLIDVVFLLLIFFMVSTTFQEESQLNIELPEASVNEAAPKDTPIVVAIDAEGRFYVDGQRVVNTQVKSLKQAISQSIPEGELPPVVIKSDLNTPWQAVLTVMDASRQLGLVKLSLPTQQAPAE